MNKPSRGKSDTSTFDTVREIVSRLPGVEEGTSYGTAAFRARGVLFIRLREDNETLAVRTEMDRRDEMIAEDPETYFLTDHYLNYPWILVRLARIKNDALGDLLRLAWQLATAKKKTVKKPRL
ncbi:MAG TPA: MmcQ/YjbR family DNA-binding protein [Pyrinomonadaceae bacterium]|jgi:hypothetical protein|nr:MmcQ/YjbR family DNA-binding protein [Pyrinomonadaceae bacterium]